MVVLGNLVESHGFEEFALFVRIVEPSAVSCANFDKTARGHCVPAMERIPNSGVIHLMCVFFDEVDKGGHLSVKIFVAFFNFEVRAHKLLNAVLPIGLPIPEIVVNQMRVFHDFLQEMRSVDASTDQH